MILSAILSYPQVMQKQLMDVEYVSVYKILFVIGLISFFFGFITMVIISNVYCNELMTENNLCPVSRPDYKGGAVYFDNFVVFLNNLGDQFKNGKKAFFLEIFLAYPFCRNFFDCL